VALAQNIPNTVHPHYFSAILEGLASLYASLSKEEKEADQREIAAAPTDFFLNVIDCLHTLPNKPCGSAIVGCIGMLSDRQIPNEYLAIVSYYAIHDPDPSTDIWQEGTNNGKYYGGEPYTHGINSVRGKAARTISQLLYDDKGRIDTLRLALSSLSADSIIAVRTCAIAAFVPLLNFDRDAAVQLFLRACGGCDAICATPPFDQFVHYATYTHYIQLRPLLQFALNSCLAESVENAARQITLAELNDVDVCGDDDIVRTGSVPMRKTAASVYANNLANETVGGRCAEQLERYFDDEDKTVREQVANAFWGLTGSRLLELKDFIARFVESKAFECGPDNLLRALEESRLKIPNIICRTAERILEFIGEEGTHIAYHASMTAHSISTLIVRQYEQTTDAANKTRCLDLIDRMEEAGYYGIGDELNRIDR
jgi:hypothetical protein